MRSSSARRGAPRSCPTCRPRSRRAIRSPTTTSGWARSWRRRPREIVERLHKEIDALVQSQEVSAQIRKLGADPLTLSIAEFQAMIDRELVENAELIKKAGIKAN